VVEGNKRTSLRQDVLLELKKRGQSCRCIRCREVRGTKVEAADLQFNDLTYHPAYAEEHFLSYLTPQDQIAGYLRLSLPDPTAPKLDMPDLENAALIREVHVYGQSLAVGSEMSGAAQHIGLGTNLLKNAEEIAREHGFSRLAVIAAIGTRRYYQSRGFESGELYMIREIK
jgi:elongator complex protein 3